MEELLQFLHNAAALGPLGIALVLAIMGALAFYRGGIRVGRLVDIREAELKAESAEWRRLYFEEVARADEAYVRLDRLTESVKTAIGLVVDGQLPDDGPTAHRRKSAPEARS